MSGAQCPVCNNHCYKIASHTSVIGKLRVVHNQRIYKCVNCKDYFSKYAIWGIEK